MQQLTNILVYNVFSIVSDKIQEDIPIDLGFFGTIAKKPGKMRQAGIVKTAEDAQQLLNIRPVLCKKAITPNDIKSYINA